MKDALASFAVLALGIVTLAALGWILIQAPAHSDIDAMPIPMLATALGGSVAAAGIGLGGAWLTWRAQLKYASMFLGILGVVWPILGWQALDAANVVFDDSPAQVQHVQFVRAYVSGSKTKTTYVVVTPWPGMDASEVALSLSLSSEYQQPGRALVLTTREGALGRAYATGLEATEP